MLLQLKDIVNLAEDDALFIDDRTNGIYQIPPSKKTLIEKKDWFVVYINSEFCQTPADDEPILCAGVVEHYEDWLKDKSHT